MLILTLNEDALSDSKIMSSFILDNSVEKKH